MRSPSVPAELATDRIIAAVRRLLTRRTAPVVVAVDGRSGSGKSTLAGLVAEALAATVVPTDDFFAADVTNAEWEARNPRDRAADAIDWRRLRREALEPLRAGAPARWHAFDFDAGARADGTYAMRTEVAERQPAAVVMLDGAYSARPELSELVDLSVLVEAPARLRRERLAAREAAGFLEAWHARWDAAEAYYFTHVRPPSSFDLVVSTAPASTAQ
jgi:uridine kinase